MPSAIVGMKPREGMLSPRATSVHARRTCSTLRGTPCFRTRATRSSSHFCLFMHTNPRLLPHSSARKALDPSICMRSIKVSVFTACSQSPLQHLPGAATLTDEREFFENELRGNARVGLDPAVPQRLIVNEIHVLASDRGVGRSRPLRACRWVH